MGHQPWEQHLGTITEGLRWALVEVAPLHTLFLPLPPM